MSTSSSHPCIMMNEETGKNSRINADEAARENTKREHNNEILLFLMLHIDMYSCMCVILTVAGKIIIKKISCCIATHTHTAVHNFEVYITIVHLRCIIYIQYYIILAVLKHCTVVQMHMILLLNVNSTNLFFFFFLKVLLKISKLNRTSK